MKESCLIKNFGRVRKLYFCAEIISEFIVHSYTSAFLKVKYFMALHEIKYA